MRVMLSDTLHNFCIIAQQAGSLANLDFGCVIVFDSKIQSCYKETPFLFGLPFLLKVTNDINLTG